MRPSVLNNTDRTGPVRPVSMARTCPVPMSYNRTEPSSPPVECASSPLLAPERLTEPPARQLDLAACARSAASRRSRLSRALSSAARIRVRVWSKWESTSTPRSWRSVTLNR